MLDDLVDKGYLKLEYPKKKVGAQRVQDPTLPLGYNIVAGKMSFEVNKILDPTGIAPTLVAMDMQHLYVIDGHGLRTLSLREGLRLFGYPDDFFDIRNSSAVFPFLYRLLRYAKKLRKLRLCHICLCPYFVYRTSEVHNLPPA